MRPPRTRGATSVMVTVFIPDNSVANGAGVAGLTNASTNLAIAYRRELQNGFTQITGANLVTITTIGTWANPGTGKLGFKAVDATNAPGLYEIHFPDDAAAFGTGDASGHLTINVLELTTTALKIGPNLTLIPLVPWNYQDGVRMGLTALPNAAAEASGGLPTLSAAQASNGTIQANVHRWLTGTPNALQSGRVDSYVGAIVNGVLAAASFASGAFDAVWTVTARTLTAATNITSTGGTTVPQTADNNTKLADIQTRLPAALTSGGNMKAGVQGFLDSVFTEGASGRIAAAFKQFFNIATPAATMDHGILVETATTLTNDPTGLTTLLSRLTASRAGYLDNLNVSGAVASQADINALNQSASRRLILTSLEHYERPESGSTLYTIEARTYDGDGAAVNADSTPTLAATGATSGDLSANLSSATNPATGVYRWTYTVSSAAVGEPIRFDVSAVLSSSTFTLSVYAQVVDLISATWTTADRTKLTGIFDKLPSKAFLTGTTNSDGDVQLNEATGALPTDSVDAGALAASAVTEIQSGLATSVNQTTILARLGALTGTGVNTVLGMFKALLSKTASAPSDVGGTFDPATDSTEAIRDRGDAAWTTATGFATPSDVPTAAQIADKYLGRNLAGGSDGGRTVQDALRFSRNKVTIDPITGVINVYAENDTTVAWTGVVTRSAADALSSVDPA